MKNLLEPAYHGGNLTKASKQYGVAADKFLDFSANINWCELPPGFDAALQRGIELIKHYPEPDSATLLKILSQATAVSPEHLVLGNGSIELIYALLRSIDVKKALVLEPTFAEYARAVQVRGGDVLSFSLFAENDWAVNFTELKQYLSQVDVVFICNPNNPTGQLTARQGLVSFIEACEQAGVLVVIDEAFIDFLEDFSEDKYGVLDLVKSFDHLVVLRSFTKFFAIPGLRLGFMAGNPRLIHKIKAKREPWNINCIAQSVGEFILSAELAPYRQTVREEIKVTREKFAASLLANLGLKSWGTANYLFFDLGSDRPTQTILDYLGNRGILLRDCSSFGENFSHYVRVAVRSPQENAFLINELKQALEVVS